MEAQDRMDADRTARCTAWLDRVGAWAGSDRRAGLACEVVRGIVYVSDPEYAAGVAWAGGEPTPKDWEIALGLYGPALTVPERSERAELAAEAARARNHHGARAAIQYGEVVR